MAYRKGLGFFGAVWSVFNTKKRERPGYQKQPLRDGNMFWEMSFATSPRSAWEALNGVEEWLDEVGLELFTALFCKSKHIQF
jgi:hypothetical protein